MIENPDINDNVITIECSQMNDDIRQIIMMLNRYLQNEKKIIGVYKGDIYCLDPNTLYYFEYVDKKTFGYTKNQVYEINLKLFEIEDQFKNYDYMRISKSCVVNVNKIKSIRPDFGQKILATLDNNERIYVSR